MSWVKLDDGFFRHPKAIRAGRDGRILFIAGMCYAGSGLTDGFVPEGALAVLAAETGIAKAKATAELLVECELWERCNGGFLIHDYLDYNQSSGKVHAERDAARERMKRNRSENVRPNISRSSQEVREPDTEEIRKDTEENGSNPLVSPPPGDKHTPKRTKPKMTGLPADFAVTDQMREWAQAKKYLTDAQIDGKTERFLNYVQTHGKQYADWEAAWRGSMDWEERGGSKGPVTVVPTKPQAEHVGGITDAFIDELRQKRLARQTGRQVDGPDVIPTTGYVLGGK